MSNPNPKLSNPNPKLSNPNPKLSNPNPKLSNPNPKLSNPNPKLSNPNPRPNPSCFFLILHSPGFEQQTSDFEVYFHTTTPHKQSYLLV